MNFDTETGSPMSCHEKVTGTCHSERSEESEVGHAARLVRPDASLPLSMTREGAFFTACRMLAPRHRSTAQATRKGWPGVGTAFSERFWGHPPGVYTGRFFKRPRLFLP